MRPKSIFEFRLAIGLAVGLLTVAGQVRAASNEAPGTSGKVAASKVAGQSIGIEGRAVVELPGTNYQVKPLDDRTELILRVEKIEPAAEGKAHYHFHFIGMEPGSYVLADYLIRPDGTRPAEIGETRLQVQAMLPSEHDGQLNAHFPRPFPFIGGYRVALVTLGVLWVGGLVAFAVAGRRKRAPVTAAVAEPEPTFAERLRPLVEAAAMGQLSLEGQANLERLLMGYWRDRLALPEMRMAEAVSRLKAHAEAGAILRAVERWLHQPGAGGASEIRTLLQPYRKLLAPAPAPAPAARADEGRAA